MDLRGSTPVVIRPFREDGSRQVRTPERRV